MSALEQVTPEQLRELAVDQGSCVPPLVQRLTDTETGKSETVPIPCGSTREAVCPSCARKARALRMQQCREGWHLIEDPLPPEPEEDDQAKARTPVVTSAMSSTRLPLVESGPPDADRTRPTCPSCRSSTGPSAARSPARTARSTGHRCS
ncbi:MAG: replication initiator [Nocardioidaceae bacterium]